mgnify:CR=1 FL=1
MTVEIDKGSGFCGGVIRAISTAEKMLGNGELYSLGAIVHNEAELERLGRAGLKTISHEDLPLLRGKKVLIRAHGEPPSTYAEASRLGIDITDCTCPVVLKLQKSIKEAYGRVTPQGGQIVIFGKVGHAEVLGLLGQTEGKALVVENLGMLREAVADGRLDTEGPVEIFSQTTKSPSEYMQLCEELGSLMEKTSSRDKLVIHNTVCSQVASRYAQIRAFAASHDAVVFVSGGHSSNGKVLYDLCRSTNPRSHIAASSEQLDKSWFRPDDRVGVCGATSTPKWLLEEVAGKILQFD